MYEMKNGVMSKNCIGGNFMNFSYKQKQDVFCQYKYCYCITKVQNGWYTRTNSKTILNNHRNKYLCTYLCFTLKKSYTTYTSIQYTSYWKALLVNKHKNGTLWKWSKVFHENWYIPCWIKPRLRLSMVECRRKSHPG